MQFALILGAIMDKNYGKQRIITSDLTRTDNQDVFQIMVKEDLQDIRPLSVGRAI